MDPNHSIQYGLHVSLRIRAPVKHSGHAIQLKDNILRDFKNAPFYILCLFDIIDLRMFSLSFCIFLQNGP